MRYSVDFSSMLFSVSAVARICERRRAAVDLECAFFYLDLAPSACTGAEDTQ